MQKAQGPGVCKLPERGGFLPRHDEDLREPLVRRQGSQVRGTLGSSLRSPAEGEGHEGFPPPPGNLEVGSHSLLQGIFPTQGSNPGLLNCRQILYTPPAPEPSAKRPGS